MAAVDEILGQVDLKELAQLGVPNKGDVERVAHHPAGAARWPGGERCRTPRRRFAHRSPGTARRFAHRRWLDLGQVDAAEGEKIAHHIFGDNQEQVLNQLGGSVGARARASWPS